MLNRKIIWFLVLTAVLAASLVPSVLVLAQPTDKFGLILNLAPWNYSSGLTPGAVNTLYLEVRNNGNTEVTNIRFGSSAPRDWKVSFDPASLNSLSPGSTNTVNVEIVPPADTSGRGDYNITLIAEANETRAVTTAFLRVEGNSPFWIWVAVGVGVIAVAVFVVIYLRYGRN